MSETGVFRLKDTSISAEQVFVLFLFFTNNVIEILNGIW